MPATLTVGEFSRLTHLPVKTLHHYHQVGVLVPRLVDPVTGYRRYAPEQVPDAHLARRLREVRMPLDEVREVLAAADHATRDAGIAAYLDRVQRELAETAAAVAALRTLLTGPGHTGAVSYRDLPAQPALALSGNVHRTEIASWCAQAYPQLMQALQRVPAFPAGAGGALYGPGWFEDGGGSVTAYLPIAAPGSASAAEGTAPSEPLGLVFETVLPPARVAVTLHAGSYRELDLSYGVLGRHVLDRGIGAGGPIRELYLVPPGESAVEAALRTEVCWPITGPEPRSTS